LRKPSAALSILVLAALIVTQAYIHTSSAQPSEVSLPPAADTYVESDNDKPNGLERYLEVRYSAGVFLSYSLLKFELAESIPANSKILSLKLTLFVLRTSSPLTVGTFFSPYSEWNESTLVWPEAGFANQTDQAPSDSKLISGAGLQSRRDYDLTAYVSRIPNSKAFTVVLKPHIVQASPSVGVVQFYSSDYPDKQFAPKLAVVFESVAEVTTTSPQPSTTHTTSQVTPGTGGIPAASTSLDLPIAGGVAGAIAVFGVFLLMRRRRGIMTSTKQPSDESGRTTYAIARTTDTGQISFVPTGTPSLDRVLNGGLPRSSSAVLLSPLTDSDVALTNFIAGACESGLKTIYFTTRERAVVAELLDRYENFGVVICHQSADTLYVGKPRVFRATLSLTQTNIARSEAEKELNLFEDAAPKVAAIDILSSLVIENVAKSVRFWLVDLLQKLKAMNFTVFASLNPKMHKEDEVAIITDVFDGEIETVDRDRITGRERYVFVKRFLDHRYDSRPARFP
jgi:KaiC/GvpD/RAD55 family RecA-like ATPase